VERFREVLKTNVTAVFALCQLAGPAMIEQGSGTIVNISSFGSSGSRQTSRRAAWAAATTSTARCCISSATRRAT